MIEVRTEINPMTNNTALIITNNCKKCYGFHHLRGHFSPCRTVLTYNLHETQITRLPDL